MEKLSSILPSNARVKAVDLKDSHPVRPGVPTFGRPVGRNTVTDRVSISGLSQEQSAADTLLYRNPKEAARAKIVSDMSKKFFETKIKEYEKPETLSEDVMKSSLTDLAIDQNELPSPKSESSEVE